MKELFWRINQYLLFVALLVVVLYFGRPFLIPVTFAALLAMLMAPICRRLDRRGFNRALSSLACVLILVAAVVGVGAVIWNQLATFAKDISTVEVKARELITDAQASIQEFIGISPEKQEEMVKQQATQASQQTTTLPAKILKGLSSTVGGLVITLVFTFLFLYSKEKYQKFFLKLYQDQDPEKVKKVTNKISDVAQKYLTGRAMSVTIIAVMYTVGLLIVGIKNAVLLACIAALLTIIPYVGTVLGGIFPVMMALVTSDSYQPAIWAAVVMFFIQTVDNYFIEPNIVGGEVNLSALVSILSILAGGLIWGVAGMILFLPMVGILKIICDNVESLKPIGYVLGDPDGKHGNKLSDWVKEKFNKIVSSREHRNLTN